MAENLSKRASRNIYFVESSVDNCSAFSIHQFDTWASTINSDAMVTYKNSLNQPTVLIGVIVDEATHSLTTAGKSALRGIGIDFNNVAYEGKILSSPRSEIQLHPL